jgi:hypothetical protein
MPSVVYRSYDVCSIAFVGVDVRCRGHQCGAVVFNVWGHQCGSVFHAVRVGRESADGSSARSRTAEPGLSVGSIGGLRCVA